MAPTLGIWIDDSPAKIATAAYWDRVAEHGFGVAALMLEGFEGGFDPRYSLDLLEKVHKLCCERDIEIALTTWPEPTLKYMAQLEEKIGSYLAASGAAELEIDAEGNWLPSSIPKDKTGKPTGGFPNLDKAGDALVQTLERIQKKCDVRTALTTYPFHLENSKSADLSTMVDRVFGQAYSVRNRTNGVVAWGSRYAPGGMQRTCLERSRTIPGVGTTSGPLICCGLAAYDQVWPGHTPEEAMRLAYDEACKYEPMEIRYWSSKWILGAKENNYASAFFRNLR
jgi:hypothetical protein